MMSRDSIVTSSLMLMTSYCIGVHAMISSYDIHTRCNDTLDMKTEGIHLGQITFNMSLHGAIAGDQKTCTVVIVPWLAKPNIQYYFSEMNLPLCTYSRLEIQQSTNGMDYSYPRDFNGRKCGISVTAPLVDKVHVITGNYLRLEFAWSKHASLTTSFTMIFNSYKTGSCESDDDYLCDNERCIVKNITCENYNTCGDHSDCSSDDDTDSEDESDELYGFEIFWRIAFAIVFAALFAAFSTFIITRFLKKDGRSGSCGSLCIASIRRLPGRCRDYFRQKCGRNESNSSQEVESSPAEPSAPERTAEPSAHERIESVYHTEIRFYSIYHTNEYDDYQDPEIGGAADIDVVDPPPPYCDEFRRNRKKNRKKSRPSAPPQDDEEELPPPPHYDEVVDQPSKYIKK